MEYMRINLGLGLRGPDLRPGLDNGHLIIEVPAPVPVPFLWTSDLRLLTWIWDLGLGLGLDKKYLKLV